jgi:large subunit ribosomal protein L25
MATLEARQRTSNQETLYSLRKKGLVPAIVYGKDLAPRPIAVDRHQIFQLLDTHRTNKIYSLKVDSMGELNVMIKEIQRDPRTLDILHVDFYAVSESTRIRVQVPIEFVGQSPLEATGEYEVLVQTKSLELECLAKDMPEAITVDLEKLDSPDAQVRVADLELPEGVTPKNRTDQLIVKLNPTRAARLARSGGS